MYVRTIECSYVFWSRYTCKANYEMRSLMYCWSGIYLDICLIQSLYYDNNCQILVESTLLMVSIGNLLKRKVSTGNM